MASIVATPKVQIRLTDAATALAGGYPISVNTGHLSVTCAPGKTTSIESTTWANPSISGARLNGQLLFEVVPAAAAAAAPASTATPPAATAASTSTAAPTEAK